MEIILLRHADAGEHDPETYPDDTGRPITEKGRAVQAKVSRALKRRGLKPDAVLTSPWKRAVQTAEILAEELGLDPPQPCEPLAAPPSVTKIRRALGGLADAAALVLVGHEPWLGQLASLLLVGDPHRVRIDFPKSGALCLEAPRFEAGTAQLRWFVRPKMV